MAKISQWFKNEFWVGYNLFEKLFLVAMVLLQIVVYCFAPDSIIGMVCGVAGVICVVLTAKAKISSYIFNFIQIVTYMIICWDLKLYLEFGGKLFDDFHASRVLPGFQPDAKVKILKKLKDSWFEPRRVSDSSVN